VKGEMMRTFCTRRQQPNSGQSLAEYALIIASVAIIVIVVAFAIGLGAERIFGILGGAFGAHHDAHGEHFITIDTAQCLASKSQNLTGLWVTGSTDEDLSKLSGSTNLSTTGLDGVPFIISDNGAGGYKFNPLLAYSVNLDVCPQSVAIQGADGTEAFAPVTSQVIP